MKKIIKRWLGISEIEETLDYTHELVHNVAETTEEAFERVQESFNAFAKMINCEVCIVPHKKILDTDVLMCISDQSGDAVVLRKNKKQTTAAKKPITKTKKK